MKSRNDRFWGRLFRQLAGIWSSEWSLTAFLVLLVVTLFFILPISHLIGAGGLPVSVFFSLLLISGMATVSEHRAPTLLVTGLVIVTLGLRWMTHLVPNREIELASISSALVCIGLLAGVVMLQVFRKGPITGHRIQGAIAVYLLMGLIWALAYELVLLEVPGAFQSAEMGERHGALMPSLVYFSFVTLTTVGYGDITPVHPIVRSLSNLEALVGQLYPAILIGRLVAMELSARQSNSREP
ncbi:MAG TPA: potassium channel family protein [Nitrospiria bacterium]|nr:potassium channel family protein [Nitrospiria bacterium]